MLTSNDPTDITFIVISTISIGYAIYLISDILGIKLYYRFKNKDSLSFTDKQAIRAILFFLGVVQLGMSYLFSLSIGRVVSDIMNFNIISFSKPKL